MKKFKSSNDINMVEGKLFNWRIEPLFYGEEEPCGYFISMGTIGEMYSALYLPDEKLLYISSLAYSSNESFKFFCDDIYVAELIIDAFIKGNKYDMTETIFHKN